MTAYDDGGFQLVFDALAAGGHPGADVLVARRTDGVVLRLCSANGDDESAVQDVFIDLEHSEQLADLLMDVVWTAQLEAQAADERKEFKRWEREFKR